MALEKYARFAGPLIWLGTVIAIALSPGYGGLEAKINSTSRLCVGQPAQVRVDVKGGRQFYHGEIKITAPDGSTVYGGSLTRPDPGYLGTGFNVTQEGQYTVQATVRTSPKDRNSTRMEAVSMQQQFRAGYCN